MARTRSGCRDDAYASYIVWPLTRDINDELRTALEQLAEVLNTVDRPISYVVEELTTRDVLNALSALPIRARQHALEPLGIHLTPKTLSQGLCRDVVGRLQRADEATARHAAFHLTAGTLYDGLRTLGARSLADAGGPDDRSLDQIDDELESRWTPALLRLALWSDVAQSEMSARVWRWAVERPWFVHGAADTLATARIRTAAENVIAHSADRDTVREDRDNMPDDRPVAPSGSPSQPATAPEGRSILLPDSRTTPDSMPVTIVPADPQTSPAASPESPESPADTEQALHAARECFALAVISAEHILADLRAGRGPADADVFAVRSAQSTYSHACSAVQEAGEEDPRAESDVRPTLDEIARMLAVRARRDADAPLRLSIAATARITSDAPGISEHVAQLRSLSVELLAAHDWTDAQRALALAIAALVELVRDPQAAPETRLELQARVSGAVASLPALAVLSMLASQLTLEAPTGTATPTGQDSQPPAAQKPTAIAAAPPPESAAGALAQQAPAADATDVSVPPEATKPSQTAAAPTRPQPDQRPAHDAPLTATDPTAQVLEAAGTATPATSRKPKPVTTTGSARTRTVPTRIDLGGASASTTPRTTTERSADRTDAGRRSTEQHAPTLGDVEQSVAELLSTCRYGLASHLAARAGWSDTRIRAFRVAGLARAVRTDTGPCGAMLRQELADLDSNQVAQDNVSLLIAVSSLVRVALITGEPAAGALLGEFSSRLDPHLANIADEIGRRALRGVLNATPALNVLADVSDAERDLQLIIEQARVSGRPRTLRFKRCTDIAKRWLEKNGTLGRLLEIVVSNDADRLVEVQTGVQHLSDAAVRERQIDESDVYFRGHSGKPIEGSGRQDLHALILETLRPVRSWIELTSALTRSRTGRDEWTTGEVADMRRAVLAQRDAALAALLTQTQTADPLLVAAAQAAHTSLRQTFAMLDSDDPLQAGEPRVTVALDLELLKVDDVVVTDAGTLELRNTDPLPPLISAVHRDWIEAFALQLQRENYPAAEYLLEMQAAGVLTDDALGDDARSRYNTALERSRAEVVAERNTLDADLRRARRSNVVTEEADSELTALLASANPTRGDLGQVRAILARISKLLPDYREQAAQRLRDRLAALDIDDEERARISDPIEKGDLLTAEELLYFQDVGEPVPRTDHSRRDLRAFFPAIPDALPMGVTTELVTAVREQMSYAGSNVLDYSHLSPDAAEQVGEALGAWRQAATAPVASRRSLTERDLLLPAIRLMGYECSKIRRLEDMPKSGERRFIEITDVRPNRDAQIPAFGSRLGGRLRVLLVWGQPTEDVLMTYADHDQSGDSLLIAHFGTMSAAARAKFATRVERTGGPVAILDDAALAYLAARGNRQLGVAMSILMPFAAVNPYIRMKRGAVAEEMFYGRDLERVQVIDPDGTQVLYGGRGLGKSALLRYAAEKFESSAEPGQRIAIYLSLDSVAAGAAFSKDALWVGLRNELIKREVLPTPTGKAKKSGDVYDQVRAGMLDWRNEDSRNRLLILLDESDQFFEADAPAFLDTKRLRDIGVVTDNNVKVVFAGLHSVQRYAKSARNGPFSHLAQRPTVIGPLRPQFAADLLTEPLGVLGYEFADDNLVNRVLGYCSYQPFLLQMFGHRLVEALHTKRRDGLAVDQPPYMITDDDVAVVERNRDLRADITSAFQDTLNLDPRYNVIANVLADHAFRFGFDARLQDAELREECLSWWRAGFESLDSESFRAYLNEMDGLGVVAPNSDGRGWRLRSPNVLNMIGNRSEVERQLLMAESESVPETFLALESRPQLSDGSSAPLTAAQLDDILGDHSTQVRVVVGSRATGLYRVDEALREVTSKAGDFDIPPISGRRAFEEELRIGRAGRRRVVIDDLASVQPQASARLEALELALTHVPTAAGVTRAAVLISSPEQAELWDSAFEHGVAVALHRYDQQTLRVWTITRQMFSHDERLQRLWNLTGGWPMLVEHAATLADSEGAQEPTALDELEAYVNSPTGRSDLLDGVGLIHDPGLARAYASIVALVDDQRVSRADLQVAADTDGSAADVVERLLALQVFDNHSDGSYSVEARLLAAWQSSLT
ncbi:hypothetical protein [Actinomycetospora lemnae]|uniref:AAA+ ATPase domain-containing protein n=1 Tax=Actinomycetospora lemnae TaxID=3019891 RepID=A0ABT5SRN3_9PSEU|nr:hypothetical protein [Actinomycetospora sp. DW7H6]MDD7965518.1 hypothetical protein [Actinomycetospora sp. DW7H6]